MSMTTLCSRSVAGAGASVSMRNTRLPDPALGTCARDHETLRTLIALKACP